LHPGFKIFAGSSHPNLAKEICNILGVQLGKISIKKFSCGEIYINFDETIRGKKVFLIGTTRPGKIHHDFFEIFLLADAARRSFAKSVHLILPHLSYSRQDKIHAAREPISAKLIAKLIETSGIDHLITLQLHSDQNQAFFDIPVDNLSPRKIFADYFRQKKIKDLVVISPDVGGAKNAKKFADELGADLAILHKSRPEHNKAEILEIIGNTKGKTPIIFDDMIDTGGSVCAAKKILTKNGSKEVFLCATHPILSGNAKEKLLAENFSEIIFSSSIPLEKNNFPAKFISIAPLFSRVIENILEKKSVSELYF